MIGAGPTGLILSQLLKLNGAAKVVLAANKGTKMDLARKLDAADVYIDLDRQNPGSQWEQIKKVRAVHSASSTVTKSRVGSSLWF
jgi:D-arabinitol dehydrogenase (NADP+)